MIPKTLTDSIPYTHVFENGIIELEPGLFSRSFSIPEVNFKTISEENQNQLAAKWSLFLNTFDSLVNVQVTLYNETINMEDFQKSVLLDMNASDNLNMYRNEYNQMLVNKMVGAKNNVNTIKILTISIKANDILEAQEKFVQIINNVKEHFLSMCKKEAPLLTIRDRLEVLNAIYNPDSQTPLFRSRIIDGKEVEAFSLENCVKQGISTKHVIAPSALEFHSNDIQVGERVAKSYYICNYPTWINGAIMTDFMSLSANILVSIYFNTIDQNEGIKLVRRQGTNVRSLLLDRQKKASRSGYDANLISPETQDAREEIDEMMNDVTKDNQRLFLTNFYVTLFAKDKEELENLEKKLKMITNKHLVTLKALSNLQEEGFNASLPLAYNKLPVERLMTSDTVEALIPFDVKDIRQPSGRYYGLNAFSNNMILYDRKSDVNMNGCILGMPGAGKSFAAKREMVNVLLSTQDEVYVLDPEGEYTNLTKDLGGSVIRIANGSTSYINPFDMNIENKGDDGDPVKTKTDFIQTICEIILGGRFGLSPVQQSLIDRCVKNIYDEYLENIVKQGKTIDTATAPTMVDFYNEMMMQPLPEAQELALSLERYVKGAVDIFAHHTNVDITNRFTVFNIKDVGGTLKELSLQICLDHIWNKMIENKAKGKTTWLYIDEFYLLMQKQTSASYTAEIWKRARKWDGVPTAITQNVEDVLKSPEARTIFNNSSFVMLLGQAPINRAQLANIFNISEEEMKYISATKPGMGLIHIGDDNIPMDDSFPKDTRLYKIMTTKPQESL